eukprot:2072457-Amphidinium_carterae.1
MPHSRVGLVLHSVSRKHVRRPTESQENTDSYFGVASVSSSASIPCKGCAILDTAFILAHQIYISHELEVPFVPIHIIAT